ncbi:hypothetical protein [Psychromonas hadalis]|uniref:hypothetical protein n=1 Tax=Psychromonas hadalis TaxID=211669 RepID=UPI0003B4F05A|nr:hypothetical protein [Psychromonas hadalis]
MEIERAEYEFPLVHKTMCYDLQLDSREQSIIQSSEKNMRYLSENNDFNALK